MTAYGRKRRIIPAYAGSTIRAKAYDPNRSDHPRIRGEHVRKCSSIRFAAGSSPHTRGAPQLRRRPPRRSGIIPAYAGSTRTPPSCSGWRPDHPRIRGEHGSACREVLGDDGSSPHTRGARMGGVGGRFLVGIIPAYAGSTARRRRRPRSPWDHPRIRGEHSALRERVTVYSGSSPHTRGAPTSTASIRPWRRIIPAYAGSTTDVLCSALDRWDHPRIRGEHVFQLMTKDPCPGSSPHTRGAQLKGIDILGRRGIIPAYAGSTRKKQVAISVNTDHPRIRGEHILGLPVDPLGAGSSPHTRGAPSF